MARSAGAKAPSPPPGPKSKKSKALIKRRDDYGSDGVENNDVFLLPLSDYQTVICLTILAAVVRLFRIWQPTSVVFDEVQYVIPDSLTLCQSLRRANEWPFPAALAVSHPSTSRASSSWTSTLPSRSSSSLCSVTWPVSTANSTSKRSARTTSSLACHMSRCACSRPSVAYCWLRRCSSH